MTAWRTRSLVLVSLFAAACGTSSMSTTAPTAVPSPRATPAPVARYQVTFEATWSASSHPQDFPSSAHFSPLVGATHGARARFWEPGAPASEGIRLMAEQGRTSPLDAEVNAAIAAGTAEHLLIGESLRQTPAQTAFEFDVSAAFPQVTLVTMVAPSPDWFVGVSGLDLLASGDWAAERTVELAPWDAGTDSGATYRAADLASAPREPVHALVSAPVAVNGMVPPMGRFVFHRIR